MSGQHTTIKADPPPNLLYDLKKAAQAERWQHRAELFAAIERVWVFAGATAGIVALALLLAGCNCHSDDLVITLHPVVDGGADAGVSRPPGHCPSHPDCGNPLDGGAGD